MPEGLPDTFKGASEKEIIDKLWKAQAEAPKPPAAATDYKLELPKDLAGVIAADDKVLPMFNAAAHKFGLTQAQYNGVIGEFYGAMNKAGMIEKPLDTNAEFAALGAGAGDTAAQIQKGIQRIVDVKTQLEGLATRQQLSKAEVGDLLANLTSRNSVTAVERLLGMLPKEHGIANGGQRGGDGLTDHERSISRMYPTMVISR